MRGRDGGDWERGVVGRGRKIHGWRMVKERERERGEVGGWGGGEHKKIQCAY